MSSNTTTIKKADWMRIQSFGRKLGVRVTKENVRIRNRHDGKKRYEIPLI